MESTFGVSSQLWMLSSSDFVRFAIQLEWKVIRGSCPPCQYLAADTMSTWKEGSSLRLHSWKLDLQEQNARSNHGLDGRKGSSCRPSPPAAPCAPPPASPAHLLRYSHLPLVSSIHIPSGIHGENPNSLCNIYSQDIPNSGRPGTFQQDVRGHSNRMSCNV